MTMSTETSLPGTILVCDDDRWGDSLYAFRDWTELKNAFREMWSDMTEEELNWLENDALPSESGIYPCYWVSENADGTAGHYANSFNSYEYRVEAFEEGNDCTDARIWQGDDDEDDDEGDEDE